MDHWPLITKAFAWHLRRHARRPREHVTSMLQGNCFRGI